MEMYHNTVQTTSGDIVNGATVTVYVASSGSTATIYDKDGNSQSNPFNSGLNRSEGEIEFAAEDGLYNIKIENGGETDWLYDVALYDPDDEAGLTSHINDASDAHDASAISNVAAGNIVATDVQAAINELDTEKTAIADLASTATGDGASLVGVEDSAGNFTGTDVEAVLAEIQGNVDSVGAAMPAGHINGLLWSNNATDATNDFDISAGEARSSDDTTDLTLSTAQTKRMDAAWSSGDNGGALATGATAYAAGVSYHVFVGVISGTTEIIVDSDPDAANAIANDGLGAYRHIFSFLVETGPALPTLTTYQIGRDVYTVNDLTAADIDNTGSVAGALATLAVPTGIQVLATVSWHCDGNGSSVYSRMEETWQTSQVPGVANADNRVATGSHYSNMELTRMTDISGQVRYRQSAALLNHRIFTKAYVLGR